MYATGMRREEAIRLTIFDVDLERQAVRVLGKGRKERTLPLGRHAAQSLRRYLQHARPQLLQGSDPDVVHLWINRRGQPLKEHSIGPMIRDYAGKAGIADELSTHTLRRTCATHMLANGAHPVMIAELLGHTRLATLSHYLRVTVKDLYAMHRKSKLGQ